MHPTEKKNQPKSPDQTKPIKIIQTSQVTVKRTDVNFLCRWELCLNTMGRQIYAKLDTPQRCPPKQKIWALCYGRNIGKAAYRDQLANSIWLSISWTLKVIIVQFDWFPRETSSAHSQLLDIISSAWLRMPPASSAVLEISSNSLENKSVFAASPLCVLAHTGTEALVHEQQISPVQSCFRIFAVNSYKTDSTTKM